MEGRFFELFLSLNSFIVFHKIHSNISISNTKKCNGNIISFLNIQSYDLKVDYQEKYRFIFVEFDRTNWKIIVFDVDKLFLVCYKIQEIDLVSSWNKTIKFEDFLS